MYSNTDAIQVPSISLLKLGAKVQVKEMRFPEAGGILNPQGKEVPEIAVKVTIPKASIVELLPPANINNTYVSFRFKLHNTVIPPTRPLYVGRDSVYPCYRESRFMGDGNGGSTEHWIYMVRGLKYSNSNVAEWIWWEGAKFNIALMYGGRRYFEGNSHVCMHAIPSAGALAVRYPALAA